MATITTIEQLRDLLPEAKPTTKAKIHPHLDEQALEFVARSPFLLLGTVGADGRLEVSPKGDEAGFVLVEDDKTIVIPDRSGNNLLFGLQNIIANPSVGVLFMTPGTGETLRLSGQAEITTDPDLLERFAIRGKPPVVAIRVRIDHSYFHCARSILRAKLWDSESWPAPQKVSFGRIIAPRVSDDAKLGEQIDAGVDAAYERTVADGGV